jgi:hypothetical protein
VLSWPAPGPGPRRRWCRGAGCGWPRPGSGGPPRAAPKLCTTQSTRSEPTAEPPHPARMNSGAARWVAAVAGSSATSSGIWGPWGCAQSWGTHTVRHFPKYPLGWQIVSLVVNSARDDGGLPEPDPPPQPAAASTTSAAASAARHRGQRSDSRSPRTTWAERTLAMVTISCRTRAWRTPGRSHARPRHMGSPISDVSPAGQRAQGRTSRCWACGYQPVLTVGQPIPVPAERQWGPDRPGHPAQSRWESAPGPAPPAGSGRSAIRSHPWSRSLS